MSKRTEDIVIIGGGPADWQQRCLREKQAVKKC